MQGPRMYWIVILASLTLGTVDPAWAETRRALLVGIDRYDAGASPMEQVRSATTSSRRSWHNLKGSVNDATSMREVLIHRFGLRESDVVLLTNEQATRAEILKHFRRHLIEAAQPGDLSIFFYAGHGSRIRNSRSTELDKKDETIVPADANTPVAAKMIVDIRDKEWDRLFTEVLDKRAKLTAIFDSCHSGSIARSAIPTAAQVRFLDEDERDVAVLIGDEPPAHPPGQEPEKREGALIISATQQEQQAKEALRRVGERGEWHGAFTLALTETLNDLSVNASAERVLDRVTAKLKAEGLQQDPVLTGAIERKRAPLFGGESYADLGRLRVNLVRAFSGNDVDLQGGFAVGLTPGTELVSKDGHVRLRVAQVPNLVRSQATVIYGDWKTLKPGDEFEVVRWGDAPPTLRVWLPPSAKNQVAIQRLAVDLRRLMNTSNALWVTDPTMQAPTHVLSWNGSEWLVSMPNGETRHLGAAPQAKEVIAHMAESRLPVRLFFNVPPSKDFRDVLISSVRVMGSPIRIVKDPDEAQYVLVGRIVEQHVEHAWMVRNFALASDTKNGPSSMPLPARTAWGDQAAGKSDCTHGDVSACLPSLAKIFHWLNLRSAGDDRRFPYELALQPIGGTPVIGKDTLREGRYRLVLEADPQAVRRIQESWGLQQRYVYVFAVDEQGRSTLLFPNEASKENEHLLPGSGLLKMTPQELAEVPLGESGIINIHAPFGTDTFVLLTSARPIPRIKELVESDEVVGDTQQIRGQFEWSISRRSLKSVANE